MTKERDNKVVLITGASSGIGRTCAAYLAEKNYTVYGTSRNGATRTEGFELITMDVADDGSVARAVEQILKREGRLDVVINNAGIGIAGAVETTPIDCARRQFETNFFGILRVCSAVLPQLRAQGSGLIINISSMGGIVGLPFQGHYCASKFALEGLTESLRMEVQQFGIKVALVNPGDFKTGFTRNRQKIDEAPGAAYGTSFKRVMAVVEGDERAGPNPEMVARTVHHIMTRRAPRVRYYVGRIPQKAVPYLRKVLPSKLAEKLIMQHYGL